MQSFDDGCLERLGRIHDSAEAEAAVKLAQDAGFDNLNLDLMYALPGQDLGMALHDVERAIALQPAHLSHYQLTLEPNTVFAARPPEGIPGHDDAWDIQERCQALLADAGFDNLNLDLMYALPGQDLAMAERDVERALALQPAHLSHYQLTLEPNTVFAARPPAGIPGHDDAWDIQEHCQALLADAGYGQYEVSAYARQGRECAHNLNYWRFGDYLGIGAGAHGKLSLPAGHPDAPDAARDAAGGAILRRWKSKHPTAWLAGAGTDRSIGGDVWLRPARRPFDYMLNALRLVEGFSLDAYEARTGLSRASIADPLGTAVARGWLVRAGDRVQPTELGRRFTNDVVGLFLED